MKKMFIYGMALGLLIAGVAANAETKLVTYPAPQSEKVYQSTYSVYVNGKQLDIYKALSPKFMGGEYYFCYFDFEGEVNVEVKSTIKFTKRVSYTCTPGEKAEADKIYVGELLPDVFKNVKKEKYAMSFTADKPFKAIVIRTEREMPLVIFGNPIEKDAPKAGSKDIVYFGPGVHYVDGEISLKQNQTLYIAGGAVVKGNVFASGDNITIRGRGIISTDNRPRESRVRDSSDCVSFENGKNLKVEGVIIKDPIGWTLVFRNCENVTIDNLKICASRMINDDAIDICNTSNVKITDTFARAQDDIIAIKGHYKSGIRFGLKRYKDLEHRNNNLPCNNITIDNCIFWTDSANTFRIGYECYAPEFRGLKCTNLYVPFYSDRPSKFEDYWVKAVFLLQPAEGMTISDMHFENIVVRSNGSDNHLIFAEPRIVSSGAVRDKGIAGEYGRIENCSFKNIKVVGQKGTFDGAIFVRGRDADHKVKNVTVENVEYFGKPITDKSPNVHIGEFTESVLIK